MLVAVLFLLVFVGFGFPTQNSAKPLKPTISVVLDVLVIKILITPFFNSLIICIFAPVVGLLVG